jgi:hypothetical protein
MSPHGHGPTSHDPRDTVNIHSGTPLLSCPLFGPGGGLAASVSHLPVHLGAMQEAVKFQIRHRGDSWVDGDVLVSNHPQAGGSHLPDITVITPVFSAGRKVFFVASRGQLQLRMPKLVTKAVAVLLWLGARVMISCVPVASVGFDRGSNVMTM